MLNVVLLLWLLVPVEMLGSLEFGNFLLDDGCCYWLPQAYGTKGARPSTMTTICGTALLPFLRAHRRGKGRKSCRRFKHGVWASRRDAERFCGGAPGVGTGCVSQSTAGAPVPK